MKHWMLKALGFFFLGLGLVGAVLPVLPTTPFLLCSTFFFSKSSDRFHRFVLDLPYFGPLVRDYETTKTIARKVKLRAMLMVCFFLSLSFYMVYDKAFYVKVALVGSGAVGLFVMSRIPVKTTDSSASNKGQNKVALVSK